MEIDRNKLKEDLIEIQASPASTWDICEAHYKYRTEMLWKKLERAVQFIEYVSKIDVSSQAEPKHKLVCVTELAKVRLQELK